jgi:hypothetical protein
VDERKAQLHVDTGTVDALIEELRDFHGCLGSQLRKLQGPERLSPGCHDALAEIYTLPTVHQGLASDLQTQVERLDDQLPDDQCNCHGASLLTWMEGHEYESVRQMQGSMSQQFVADPTAFVRANYVRVLSSYALWPPRQ